MHLAIPWARYCQYQCVCNLLSNYFKGFKSYGHFSVRGQNLRKLSSHGHTDVGARQILDQLQMSFCNPLGYVLSISMCLQCYQNIPNCLRVIGLLFFFFFFCKLSGLFANCPGTDKFDYRACSESQPSAALSVDFLRVVHCQPAN